VISDARESPRTTDAAPGSADPTATVAALVRQLRSTPSGLSSAEAADRLLQVGPNLLTERRSGTWVRSVVAQFTHPLAILLELAAVLSFLTAGPVLGWTIVAVVVLNAAFALSQEWQAERALDALREYLPQQAVALRDGRPVTVAAADLVPGDVVVLGEGQRISADGRIVTGELEVDLSPLTGESAPALRTADPDPRPVPRLEADDLVFSGSTCVSGTGRVLVFATGDHTELGRIATLSQVPRQQQSPLEKQVKRVAWLIALVAVGVGLAFLPLGLGAGLGLAAAATFAIGLLVANVPEGLLPTITLALAAGVRHLAARGAVVKRLSSVQTLGSTTVICTDKTGTLTQNRMSPELAMVPGREVDLRAEVADRRASARLARALRACAVTAGVAPGGEDPTEVALLEAGVRLAGGETLGSRYHRERVYPFRAATRRSSAVTTWVDATGRHRCLHVKGAPASLLDLCSAVAGERGCELMTTALRDQLDAEVARLTARGLRVLAVAERDLEGVPVEAERSVVENRLCFLGLVGLLDPPRESVAAAVATCHDAGLRVVVITGDDARTTAEISRQVGITAARTVDGRDADSMSEVELTSFLAAPAEVICSRSSPENKMRIARNLQAQGEVVAMTGDGVNDAPALRQADVGIAMGLSGTDVAREAATLVLTDDDFSTIVTAVEEGRRIFDNVRKFILYIFAHAVPEVVPFLVFALSGGRVPLPLTVLLILAIDLGTETLPALALGREPAEPGIMQQPPRSAKEPLVRGRLLLRAWGLLGATSAVLAMGAFLVVLLRAGWRPGDPTGPGTALHHAYLQATTTTFLAIVACQVGTALAARTDRVSLLRVGLFTNRLLLLGIGFELVFAVLLIYTPAAHRLVGTASLPVDVPLLVLPFPVVVWGVDEVYRWLLRRSSVEPA
jgi:calcium-translocating P-type ATPase